MLIAGFPSDATDTNCYVVAPGAGEQCVVIDPGIGVTGQLDEVIAEHRLHPVAVLLTHGHFDHTFSVLPVCQARDVPAYIHPGDRPQLADPWTWVGLPKGTPLFGTLTFAEPDDVVELPAAGTRQHRRARVRGDARAGPQPRFGGVRAHRRRRRGAVLRRRAVRRLHRPHRPARRLDGRTCIASLRDVVLPMDDATVVLPRARPRRPPSRASAPPTPSCRTSR